ncbi:MAG TPA: GntR family transcriptional regulator [Gaiellaceae bacterium]|nr:GntR family transcriptional regulator [Gaiellaceae bacterium]
MSATGRLHIQSVVDQVYDVVRSRILSGDLPGGSRLPQTSLAEELGVSRTPLREALRRLSTEGLVELEANRGATVAQHDLTDQMHAWRARLVLEPPAARLAAEVREPAALERMRVAIRRQRQVADDIGESFAVNREFHLALVAAAGNPHLVQFAQTLWMTRIGVPIFTGQAVDRPEDVRRWADDHEAILRAVTAKQGAAAERLTRAHIAASPPRRD